MLYLNRYSSRWRLDYQPSNFMKQNERRRLSLFSSFYCTHSLSGMAPALPTVQQDHRTVRPHKISPFCRCHCVYWVNYVNPDLILRECCSVRAFFTCRKRILSLGFTSCGLSHGYKTSNLKGLVYLSTSFIVWWTFLQKAVRTKTYDRGLYYWPDIVWVGSSVLFLLRIEDCL